MKFIKSNKYLILSLAIIAFIAGLITFDKKLAPSSDTPAYYLLGKTLISDMERLSGNVKRQF